MSALITISSVAGAGPAYVLTVASSTGVVSGDHVVAPLFGSTTEGGVYRVTGVPDGATINVTDDIKPSGTYGLPKTGSGQAYTPTANFKLSQQITSGPFWGNALVRDMGIADANMGGVTDHGALTGLGDDDHAQYLLANGTRTLEGEFKQKNHVGFSGSEFTRTTKSATTIGATTAIVSILLPDNTANWVTAKVVGRGIDGTTRAVYMLSCMAVVDGGLAYIGGAGTQSDFVDETVSGLNASFFMIGVDSYAKVLLTGVAGTTVHWVVTIEKQSVNTSA